MKCPKCESKEITKAGLSASARGMLQKWFCKNCNHFFREEKPIVRT